MVHHADSTFPPVSIAWWLQTLGVLLQRVQSSCHLPYWMVPLWLPLLLSHLCHGCRLVNSAFCLWDQASNGQHITFIFFFPPMVGSRKSVIGGFSALLAQISSLPHPRVQVADNNWRKDLIGPHNKLETHACHMPSICLVTELPPPLAACAWVLVKG